MRTRKGCYDVVEERRRRKRKTAQEEKTNQTVALARVHPKSKKTHSDSLYRRRTSARAQMSGSGDFLTVLYEARLDRSMWLPSEERFWAKIAEKYNQRMGVECTTTADECLRYAQRLRHLYLGTRPAQLFRHPPSDVRVEFEEIQVLLEKVFGDESSETLNAIMNYDSVPETPPGLTLRYSEEPTDFVIPQATSSTIDPELERRVFGRLLDLTDRKLLGLSDVVRAESYLSTSTWASGVFLKLEDEVKQADAITEMVQEEDKKRRRR